MPVLGRSELEQSPLADLHLIASELGLDGFRRLRKADLVAAILARQGGDSGEGASDDAGDVEVAEAVEAVEEAEAATSTEEPPGSDGDEPSEARPRRRRGGRRGRGGGGGGARDADSEGRQGGEGAGKPEKDEEPAAPQEAERTAEGVIEILDGGSGFVRLTPPEPSEEDVYVSAAQVRRCELMDGDTVTGPVRPPRRSERYPSLVRVDTINGVSADQVAAGTPYEELPAAFPQERLVLGGEDPTVKAIEWLTPFGRGSRVTIVGPARAGKTEALRRIAAALAGQDGLAVSVVLAGVRPEEISLWREGPVQPAGAVSFAASADAQAQAVERAVDQARRAAARGGNAVVLVDSLDALQPQAARRVLGAARNIADGGSLTIVATAPAAVGGETTVIALDEALAGARRFPALDLLASGTLRPELLVGEAGADAIARARAEAAAAAASGA